MNRLLAATAKLALVALALGAFGCGGAETYRLQPLSAEAAADKIDGTWFSREIVNGQGELVRVELVYCPVLPGQPTVCRSAIVWEKEQSTLLPVARAPG